MIKTNNNLLLKFYNEIKSISKGFHVLLVTMLFILYACGDPVPIQELGDAKIAINKAVKIGALSYAAKKLGQARKALYQAHDFVAKEEKEDAKKKAIEATELANLAKLITVTHIAKNKAKDELKKAREKYDSAVVANAEMFAPGELKKSKSALDQATEKFKETVQLLEKADKEDKTDLKKYENVQKLAKETEAKAIDAQNSAITARKICAEQVPSIKSSIRDVENTILVAESIGGKRHAASKLQTARNKAATAKSMTNDMRLKKALEELSQAKINADEALIIAKEMRSKEKIASALKAISQAEKSIAAEKKQDQLKAAKESYEAAKKSHSEKRYDDSYSQSEESIRLAKVVIDAEAEMIAEKQRKAAVEEARLRELRGEQAIVKMDTPLGLTKERLKELIDFWPYLLKNSKIHTVKWVKHPRQTLWRISQSYYKDARLWPRIFRVNKDKIKDPDLIYPRQRFIVPNKKIKIPADLQPLKVLKKELKELNDKMKQ